MLVEMVRHRHRDQPGQHQPDQRREQPRPPLPALRGLGHRLAEQTRRQARRRARATPARSTSPWSFLHCPSGSSRTCRNLGVSRPVTFLSVAGFSVCGDNRVSADLFRIGGMVSETRIETTAVRSGRAGVPACRRGAAQGRRSDEACHPAPAEQPLRRHRPPSSGPFRDRRAVSGDLGAPGRATGRGRALAAAARDPADRGGDLAYGAVQSARHLPGRRRAPVHHPSACLSPPGAPRPHRLRTRERRRRLRARPGSRPAAPPRDVRARARVVRRDRPPPSRLFAGRSRPRSRRRARRSRSLPPTRAHPDGGRLRRGARRRRGRPHGDRRPDRRTACRPRRPPFAGTDRDRPATRRSRRTTRSRPRC